MIYLQNIFLCWCWCRQLIEVSQHSQGEPWQWFVWSLLIFLMSMSSRLVQGGISLFQAVNMLGFHSNNNERRGVDEYRNGKLDSAKLTHWSSDKMADIFKCIFLNENFWIANKIPFQYVPYGLIDNISALVQDRRQAIIWSNDGVFYL